ncbi:hypothetical protein CRUP_019681, partial [Coryphaenoides rupestris]
PVATYGSVHHGAGGRRPLAKGDSRRPSPRCRERPESPTTTTTTITMATMCPCVWFLRRR